MTTQELKQKLGEKIVTQSALDELDSVVHQIMKLVEFIKEYSEIEKMGGLEPKAQNLLENLKKWVEE